MKTEITKMLIIDNDDMTSYMLEDLALYSNFAAHVINVSSSKDGDDVYKQLLNSQSKPECILIDAHMSSDELSGLDLCKKIKEVYGNGVVISLMTTEEMFSDDFTVIQNNILPLKGINNEYIKNSKSVINNLLFNKHNKTSNNKILKPITSQQILNSGAQSLIIKNGDVENNFTAFAKDYNKYALGYKSFKVYR